MLDALVRSEGEPDLVQISGGEPTIHPQILDILAAARRRPIKHVMLNTNGIRIAEDPAFCDALAELRPGFEVYLQFDSLNDDALKNIRGAALSRIRRQALANLEARNISTTLVCTVKRGVNDTEIGEIVRHALKYKCVRGINFQPVQDAGRNEGFDPKKNRIVLSEIRRRIVEDSGVFADGDMIPLPCNPASISIGYGVRDGEKVIPLTSLVPREALLPAVPNAISFEKYPELRQRFVDLLVAVDRRHQHGRAAGLAALLPARRADARGLGLRERLPRHHRGVPRPLQFLPGQRQALLRPFRDPGGRHHPVRHLQHLLSPRRGRERAPGRSSFAGRHADERSQRAGSRSAATAGPPAAATERPRARLVLRHLGLDRPGPDLGLHPRRHRGQSPERMGGVAILCGSPTLILGGVFLWLGSRRLKR